MKCIYTMTNKNNGKIYVGQTNNFQKRMIAHKSDANNPKSHSHSSPLSCAIRKHGWEKFENKIVEEFPDSVSQKELDEREKFFILFFNSKVKNNGYNISEGGQGYVRPKLSYEEKLQMSSIFKPDEIRKIQEMLKNGDKPNYILTIFYPKLTSSFLFNINAGLNFKNDKWEYPLHVYKEDMSHFRSEQEIKEIRNDIKSGMLYKDVSQKWNLSIGMISLINNGKQWKSDEETYPLSIRGTSRSYNAVTWVKDVQKDLMKTKKSLKEIAEKYNKAYSTIKKINSGSSHRNEEYKYPLTSNRT